MVAATLTFDFEAQNSDNKGEVSLRISDDGGGTWQVLEDYAYDAGSGSESFDITEYASPDTQIRFDVEDKYAMFLFIDDIQIEYTTSCGSTGSQTCAGCMWGTCNPPADTCNGLDDDCDIKRSGSSNKS